MAQVGTCHICGATGPLTKEHIPPKGALKGRGLRLESVDLQRWLAGKTGRTFQNGFHKTVLCRECNNTTGHRYGDEFARWSTWGLGLLDQMRLDNPGVVPGHVGYPARIAKQVVASLLASSQLELGVRRPELRDFVRRSEARLEGLRLRTFLCSTPTRRMSGVAGRLNMETGATHVMVELVSPPFGYILTLDGDPQDKRPVDIGWFATVGYDDKQLIDLPAIPVLPAHLPMPEDYRSADEIRQDVVENILLENEHPSPREEAARIMQAGEGQAFFLEHGEDWDRFRGGPQ